MALLELKGVTKIYQQGKIVYYDLKRPLSRRNKATKTV
jgi:hypothetical protein